MSNSVVFFDLTVDPQALNKKEMRGIRVAFAISGILAIGFGLMVLFWPQSTMAVVATLFGLYFLCAGIVHVVRGIFIRGASASGRVISILLGLALVISGIVIIRNPLSSLVVLTMVIGISWIIEGVVAIAETAAYDTSRWFGWLFGLVSIAAGTVVLLTPVDSLAVLVWIGGIFLVVSGVVQVIQSFTFGRDTRSQAA